MKTKLIYAGLFLASLLVSTELVLVLVPRQRASDAKTTVGKQEKIASRQDTVAAQSTIAPSVHDSTRLAVADTIRKQPVETGALRDSVKLLSTKLAAAQDRVASLMSIPPADTTHPDTTRMKERKAMAKLVDAMDAQGAAKILRNMDDNEVKEILLAVKKRQAGKILSSLDPERAARIMR
jgi:flagellar motility protein MotE (MotC chaperone)